MDFDPYMPCPGGKDKKLRFCCRDLVKDLEKLWRMTEGEQYRAALQQIDQLRSRPELADRACLLAIRAQLLRELEMPEEAQANARHFVEKHPDNPTAWAEQALVHILFDQNVPKAVDAVQEALERADGAVPMPLLRAMYGLALLALREGFRHSAWSLWMACAELTARQGLAEAHKELIEHAQRLDRASHVPLLLKSGFRLRNCPDDVPWKPRFVDALAPVARHCWRLAAQRLAELTQEVPDSPIIWHDLAVLRAWLADIGGATEALRRQAECEESLGNLEDAVEAETLAMLLEDDPLKDQVEEYGLSWTVREPNPVHEALLSDPRVLLVPVSEELRGADDYPLPKLAAVLVDRPIPEATEELTPEQIPVILGYLALFGRQTDQAARLQLDEVRSTDLDQVVQFVRQLGGENLEPDFQREVTATMPGIGAMIEIRWAWPRGASQQQIEKLADEWRRRVLFEHWLQTPAKLFDGRSPQEAAGDPTCRRRLLAVILMFEQWLQAGDRPLDLNQLRRHLGLPTLEPLDLGPGQIQDLPAVRLRRVRFENLSDEDFTIAYYRAAAMQKHDKGLMRHLAKAAVERTSLSNVKIDARLDLATLADSYHEATRHLDEAQQLLGPTSSDSGLLDLLRLNSALKFGEREEANRLLKHIRRQHGKDPAIMEQLFRMLVSAGLLQPDGSLREPPAGRAEKPAAQPQSPAPAKLWTPGSDQDGGPASGAAGGIWTPD